MNKKVIIIAAIAILAVFFLLGGRSPEKTAKQFLEATHEANAKKFVSLMCDELIEKSDAETKKVFIKKAEDTLNNTVEQLQDKYGKKFKYDIEIVDCYEYTPSEYASDYMSQFIGEDMREVAYSITYEGKGWLNDEEGEDSGKIQLIKKGRKWYVANFS